MLLLVLMQPGKTLLTFRGKKTLTLLRVRRLLFQNGSTNEISRFFRAQIDQQRIDDSFSLKI